ncbi:MAG: type IV secretory system conjugative DNA transfer family protein [Mycobacteriaceae bacterium]|nr:type IV secretory system conjugative DNA transfer family protein [Mycobacteriaceae bacterium]
MYLKPATPYCGFLRRRVGRKATEQLYVPSTAAHVLVSAPTETGKTRRVLAPAAVMWGGPAVVVSSKDDLLQYVMERRFGPKAMIDLRPIGTPVYPDGVDPLFYDPTVTIESPLEALTIAETIMQMATVGLGSGADEVSDGGIWESQAAGPLAAFLYAASPQGNGEGMDWVLRAVDNIDPENFTEPGWAQAAALCRRYEVLALGMMRILQMDPRQRDSVAITMRKAITPWLRLSLSALTTVAMSTSAATPTLFNRAFDPVFLDDPQATLFVLAPADGTVAGAAVTLLDSLVRRWREKTARREQMHRLLMVIDELPNTAPIPSLRRIVGEGRGLGINMVAAVQASCQLDTVYGRDYADELRAIFPASLIMYGAREIELLEAGEDWSLFTNRRPESYSQADGHRSLSSDMGPGLRWQELLPPNRETARLLVRGDVGKCVEIPDWTVFRSYYDAAVKTLLNGAGNGDKRAGGDGRVVERLRKLWADSET